MNVHSIGAAHRESLGAEHSTCRPPTTRLYEDWFLCSLAFVALFQYFLHRFSPYQVCVPYPSHFERNEELTELHADRSLEVKEGKSLYANQ